MILKILQILLYKTYKLMYYQSQIYINNLTFIYLIVETHLLYLLLH